MDLLVPSEKVTSCPYKGTARYYSVRIGDRLFPDIVWSYPNPIPESTKIKGYLCFFDEHVDEILLDDVPVPRPVYPVVNRLAGEGGDATRHTGAGGETVKGKHIERRDSRKFSLADPTSTARGD